MSAEGPGRPLQVAPETVAAEADQDLEGEWREFTADAPELFGRVMKKKSEMQSQSADHILGEAAQVLSSDTLEMYKSAAPSKKREFMEHARPLIAAAKRYLVLLETYPTFYNAEKGEGRGMFTELFDTLHDNIETLVDGYEHFLVESEEIAVDGSALGGVDSEVDTDSLITVEDGLDGGVATDPEGILDSTDIMP
ncbi:hypothetical protein KC727_00510 [Candidatus Kaiserbacteria bacterium]|nr:hypothetical protein [Candidatus Kaiserbacteria bacterium]